MLPAVAGEAYFRGRLDPHLYGGSRGSEPKSQVLVQGVQDWFSLSDDKRYWRVALHGELESFGSRDMSLDVDRAWTEIFPLASSPFQLVVGRAHPWDFSAHPFVSDPFSASANQHAQNRGVLLGYGWEHAKPIPSPVVMGWLGIHAWTDRKGDAPAAVGISFSPIFVPSLGSEVSLSSEGPARVGRFGRRPPGTAIIEGKEIPVTYSLANYRLFEDVLFHPQFLLQSRFQSPASESVRWQAWLSLSRAPRPDPVVNSKGVLRVTEEKLSAFAIVEPSFPSVWMVDVSQVLSTGKSAWAPKIFGSVYAKEDRSRGFEVGIKESFLRLSVMNTEWVRSAPSNVSYSDANYGVWLVRADSEVELPLWQLKWYGGWYQHWLKKDSWARTALTIPFSLRGKLDIGADLFSGGESTFFGEWRTNDRLFAVFTWEIFE